MTSVLCSVPCGQLSSSMTKLIPNTNRDGRADIGTLDWLLPQYCQKPGTKPKTHSQTDIKRYILKQYSYYQTRWRRGCSTNTFFISWLSWSWCVKISLKHYKSQTTRARKLQFKKKNVHPLQHITCPMARVTCHMSHVTRLVSVIYHMSPFIPQESWLTTGILVLPTALLV